VRIAFISTMSGLPWGGSEELWAAAAEHARATGHEVLACVNRWPEVPRALEHLVDQGVQLVRVPRRKNKGFALAVAGFTKPRTRALDRFRPDIVCISQGSSYEAALQRRFHDIIGWLRHTGTPYVVVCHSSSEASPFNTRTRNQARAFLAGARQVAFVAERNRLSCIRHLAVDLPDSMVLRNPVNMSSIDALPWPSRPAEDCPLVACVGRHEVAHKGQDVLLDALASEPWRSRNFRLSLVGTGPDEQYLKDLAARGVPDGRVTFPGYAAAIRALWAEHHILILPSREEGAPLVLVEAMLCARPAIVTDIGGNAEWISEGSTGFIAAAPTVREIASALERAWQSRARWRQMGQDARAAALRLYDPRPGKTLVDLLIAAASRDFQRA